MYPYHKQEAQLILRTKNFDVKFERVGPDYFLVFGISFLHLREDLERERKGRTSHNPCGPCSACFMHKNHEQKTCQCFYNRHLERLSTLLSKMFLHVPDAMCMTCLVA